MTSRTSISPERRDRLIKERIHDTYKLRRKLAEPTRCPQCGALYAQGRWTWPQHPVEGADEQLCSACHRINDNYPAGELTLSGAFLEQHKGEIIGLARNLEAAEKAEHPMNRIIEIRDLAGELLITTTDVHLPARIGKAVQSAWEGALDIHFDEEAYFTSIVWRRDD